MPQNHTPERLAQTMLHLARALVASGVLPSVCPAECGTGDFDFELGLPACAAACARRAAFVRTGDAAQDLCIAHFEVRGAVGGGLSGDLRVDAAEFVPAPSVEAEEGERVCACVQRHCGLLRGGAGLFGLGLGQCSSAPMREL